MLAGGSSVLEYVVEKYKTSNRPLSAVLELTYECNLQCVHCYVPGLRSSQERILSSEEIKDVLEQLHSLGVIQVTITGGEVTTRPDWLEIARFAKRAGFFLTIFTNGTQISEDDARELAAIQPDVVEISIYGGNRTSYESVTGSAGSFAALVRGIEALKGRNVNTLVKHVVMQQNAHAYQHMVDFSRKNGLSVRLEFNPLLISNGADPWAYRLSDVDMTRLMCSEPKGSFGICSLGKTGLVMSPYGEVRPCVAYPESAGNVRRRTLSDIWHNSKVFAELRSLKTTDFALCGQCDSRLRCCPCIAMNLLENGVITQPSRENCRITRNRRAKEMLTK